ncbi:peptidoglycan-associated lipoprotein Pal [Rhodobium gokarnense]
MLSNARFAGAMRLFAVAVVALTVAACANKPESNINGVAPGSPQDFVVNVGDRVLFDVDSSSLDASARSTLDGQARWLAQYSQYSLTIEGHADERGTREYNLALGARRASAVRDYLASQGVSPGRLRTISYGKERPVAVCSAESCWSQNRRAVSVVSGAGS